MISLTAIVPSILYINAIDQENKTIKQEFNLEIDLLQQFIQNSINANINEVITYSNIFKITPEMITRKQHKNFTDSILRISPYIQSINLYLRVLDKDREYFEQLAKNETGIDRGFIDIFANGSIGPSENRNVYFPVYYLNPLQNNIGGRILILGITNILNHYCLKKNWN